MATKTLSLLSIILPLLLSITSTSTAYIPATVDSTSAFSSLSFVRSLAGVPIWSPYQFITPYIYNQLAAVSSYYHATQGAGAPLFNQLQANQLFNQLQSNQFNQLFQNQQANHAFNQLEDNQLFNQLKTNQAFNQQQANQLFLNAELGNYHNLPSSLVGYPATRAIVV